MNKGIIAILIICIMIISGALGIYTYSTSKYYTWGLNLLPVYDFTISIQDGLNIMKNIGDRAIQYTDDFLDFTPMTLVKVNYRKTYNNITTNTFIIIYAPQNEDFENLHWNRYYRIYAYNKYDYNLKEIISDGYNYIVPYYQNMTSRWWWLANINNNPDYNKLYFDKSTQTDGTGIEPNNQYTYEFVSTEVITTENLLNLTYEIAS